MKIVGAKRRGGSMGVSLGLLSVAGSSAILLGVGPRLIDSPAFSGLGLVWTVATVFGFGLAMPTEQLVNRRLNASAASDRSSPVRWLWASAAVCVGAAWFLGSRAVAAENFAALVPGMALAIIGWAAVSMVRGRLLGVGDLRAYAVVLHSETVARLGLIAAAWIIDEAVIPLLALAVGAPLVVGAIVGSCFRVERGPVTGRAQGNANAVEQLAFIIGAMGYQVCLNAPPLLLEWRWSSTAPAVIGAFVVATSYFRASTVLAGGITIHALTELSRAWGDRNMSSFSSNLSLATRRGLITSAVVAAVGLVAAPVLLPLIYGSQLGLPFELYVSLAISTMIAVQANLQVTALLAADRGTWAATCWTLGALTTLAPLALLPANFVVLSCGLIVGPTVAFLAASWATSRLFRPSISSGAAHRA